MFAKGWMVMKATLAFPPLLLCAVSYAIFHDEFFGQYISASLLVCFSFLFPCFIVILGGICAIRLKPYAEGRLIEEIRDCDLETENEIGIKPLYPCTSDPIQQFFTNIYSLCVSRPVYGIILAVGLVVLSAIWYILSGMEDPELEADIHLACMQLVVPSLLLIAVVIFIANSGLYPNTPSRRLQSYHPFQESVEVPISVLFRRTFAVVLNFGPVDIFYALLGFVAVTVGVNFLDQIKNFPEKTMEELQTGPIKAPSNQFLDSAIFVLTIASGFFPLACLILSTYVKAKNCTLAIVEKNWRRNFRAIEYLLKGGTYETLEDLQAALDAKRIIKTLSSDEIKAFDYIAMPLWQTRRPFVDMTQDAPALQQENVDLPRENPEVAEESPSDSANEPVQEQVENPEDNVRTDDQREEGTLPSTSATNVTRRHTRQLSIVDIRPDIRPARITRRRQEVPIPEEAPEEEEIPQDSDDKKDLPQDESSRETLESLSELDSPDESVQEQVGTPEDNTRTGDRREEETLPSTSATNVTRRHTRQLSIVNIRPDIRPARITRRRQEVPIPEEAPEEEEIPQNGDANGDVPEEDRQEGSSKTGPTRVTRRREYYDRN